MSGLVYALALFGCSDDATVCERLNDTVKTFESRIACEMETASAIDSDLALRADFPTVIAQCMSQGLLTKLEGKQIDLSRGAALASASDPRPRS
ncbi:MAG TPA: hypothetical protein VJM34_16850 [Novosphingobium sp.]|nr:hypothetical protein [Novosphingobium sp.]